MRHSNSGKKLSRNPSHRKALLRNMSKALLTHGRIRTTEIKAKELRGVVESLITLARRNDVAARRLAYRELGSHQLVQKLFDEIAPRFAGIPGGYTRVVKLAMPPPRRLRPDGHHRTDQAGCRRPCRSSGVSVFCIAHRGNHICGSLFC